MKTLMVVMCVVLVLGGATSSARACEVDLVSIDASTWYVFSDACVQSADLWWEPEVRPDKRWYRKELGSTVSAVHEAAIVPVSWRLEFGDIDAFDWDLVKAKLEAEHNVVIGEQRDCTVCGTLLPAECYHAMVEVYPAYERRLYEVTEGGAVAVIAVLTPRDGMALVYGDPERLGYFVCTDAAEPQSALGTCGSASAIPAQGISCRETSGGTNKLRPRDQPVQTPPETETGTWGAVKALYGAK